jgi:hypothetical protein
VSAESGRAARDGSAAASASEGRSGRVERATDARTDAANGAEGSGGEVNVQLFWCEPLGDGHPDNAYRRVDTGETFLLGQAAPGACYYADWLPHRGPDGHCLIVITPYGPWNVDGGFQLPSPGVWTRTGTPPKVTVAPSIGQGQRAGGGWTYHAWLRDGVLQEIP